MVHLDLIDPMAIQRLTPLTPHRRERVSRQLMWLELHCMNAGIPVANRPDCLSGSSNFRTGLAALSLINQLAILKSYYDEPRACDRRMWRIAPWRQHRYQEQLRIAASAHVIAARAYMPYSLWREYLDDMFGGHQLTSGMYDKAWKLSAEIRPFITAS